MNSWVKRLVAVAAVLGAAAFLYFSNLGRVGFFEPDEGRYVDMAREMVASGDWITPRLNYVKHFHKPPLAMWAVASSLKAFGFSEFSARLPNALFALATLALVIALGAFLFRLGSGLFAACILATSALFFATSRLVTTDMCLTFWVTASMFALALLLFSEKPRPIYFYFLALALGCGFLTKGPVALLAPLSTLIVFGLLRRRWLPSADKHGCGALLLFCVITLSWFLWVILHNPGLLKYFLSIQVAERVVTQKVHFKPFWYLVPVLAMGFYSWIVHLPCAIQKGVNSQRSKEERDRSVFLLIWFTVPFLLFTLFRSKLPFYIAPLFPALALLAGDYWGRWQREETSLKDRFFSICNIVWIASYVALFGAAYFFLFVRTKYIAGIPKALFVPEAAVLVGALVGGLCVLAAKKYRRIFWVQLASLVLTVGVVTWALPFVSYKQSKPIAEQILQARRGHEKVIEYKVHLTALPAYLGERLITVAYAEETAFENPKDLENYVFQDEKVLMTFLEGAERVLVVTRLDEWNALQNRVTLPLYPLFILDKWILFSNQP